MKMVRAFFSQATQFFHQFSELNSRIAHIESYLTRERNWWDEVDPLGPKAIHIDLSTHARRETIKIMDRDMPTALLFFDQAPFLTYCLDQAPAEGLFCEFGVFSGHSITIMANHRPNVTFDGFDSFEGLPSNWEGYMQFDFNRGGNLPSVPANVKLHAGWFDETLPKYLPREEKLALLHVDCDLYVSTKTIFRYLGDKIVKGTVIVFDEYFCYPRFEQHEYKAFQEFLAETGHKVRWIACCGQKAACIVE